MSLGTLNFSTTYPVVSNVWLYPCGECSCRFNEEELAVAIHDFDPDVFVSLSQFPKEVDNNPFVFNGVTIVGATL